MCPSVELHTVGGLDGRVLAGSTEARGSIQSVHWVGKAARRGLLAASSPSD